MEELGGLTASGEPELRGIVHVVDERGTFAKPFPPFNSGATGFQVAEIFWSSSARGTIRGMHFQTPPSAIAKIVWVTRGSIVDVLVDLRSGPGFGKVYEYKLTPSTQESLWVPGYFAHGFQALEDDTIVNYAVDGIFDRDRDAGIHFASIDFRWPLDPTQVSPRDRSHPALADFATPFS